MIPVLCFRIVVKSEQQLHTAIFLNTKWNWKWEIPKFLVVSIKLEYKLCVKFTWKTSKETPPRHTYKNQNQNKTTKKKSSVAESGGGAITHIKVTKQDRVMWKQLKCTEVAYGFLWSFSESRLDEKVFLKHLEKKNTTHVWLIAAYFPGL